jgi:FdhE protein
VTRAGAVDPLRTLARERPEWSRWLALLDAVREETTDSGWDDAVPAAADDAAAGSPVLAEARAVVDPRLARRWVQGLATAAAGHGGPAATLERTCSLSPLALLEACVESDAARLDALATTARVEPAPLRAIAPLVAMPLLHACARVLGARVPDTWRAGYCPICGAWATLAEARGLERSRRLRCGRCGGDWSAEWLRCPFCDTTDHAHLGALVPEDPKATQRVETCAVCRGYLKVVTTLTARGPLEVALDDVRSAALDLTAIEHGYARPPGPGRSLGIRLEARRRRWLGRA